jgi:hypothetical protein
MTYTALVIAMVKLIGQETRDATNETLSVLHASRLTTACTTTPGFTCFWYILGDKNARFPEE